MLAATAGDSGGLISTQGSKIAASALAGDCGIARDVDGDAAAIIASSDRLLLLLTALLLLQLRSERDVGGDRPPNTCADDWKDGGCDA